MAGDFANVLTLLQWSLYIARLQAWRESPTDLGKLFVPIIAKGYVYPHGKNHGLFLYDSPVWIYFVVVSQKIRILSNADFLLFTYSLFTLH